MAVVKMQKIRLFVHATDVDATLDVIQKSGALEFRQTEIEEMNDSKISFPHAQLLPRVQHALQFLKPYAPERTLWKTLREGSQTELSESDIKQKQQDTDAIQLVVDDLEKLQVEFTETYEKIRTLKEQYQLLQTWKSLPISLKNLSTQRTRTLLVTQSDVSKDKSLEAIISEICVEAEIPFSLTKATETSVAVTLPNDNFYIDKTRQKLEAATCIITPTPLGQETPDIEFVAVSEQLAAAKSAEAILHDQAEHFAITHYQNLLIASEILSWQRDRFAIAEFAKATKYTHIFEGWINESKKASIENLFSKRGLAATFTTIEPKEGEEPPVDIENSPLIQPFEAVTRLYGMPGHKDLDPTVFLAGFFFLFFGLSLTDVGYGLFLIVASILILTILKVAPAIRLFAKLLLFVGFSTVLVGMLFGGYLGIAPEYIPEFLKKLQMYDPIGNPLPVFYTALGLGVIQVMVGIILKIYSEYRNDRLMSGILDQGPWLLIFTLGIIYLGTSLEYISFLTIDQIINLIYTGVILIIVTSGRHGKTILEKVRNAALSLYNSIGYFSDILSYSRLLALGLATTALAFAVNLIAGMISSIPYVGVILAVIVLVIGHLFTLAVNTLGAFIHSARLQFVEFFGKFIAGTGKEFSPLARSQNHVTVTDD